MKVRAIRSFIDKYSMKQIKKDEEIEVTEERFSELTTGPRGVFVEKIVEDNQENDSEKTNEDETLK